MTLPKTCHTWQYSSAAGSTLEQTLKLNPTAPVPIPSQSQHLIRILHTALNPVDHKPAEHFLFGRMLPIPALATPGIDFAGIVVTPAIDSALREGTLVFGVAAKSPFAAGALSEYAACEAETTVIVPEDVSAVDASTVGVAGLTALQCIQPYVKRGDHVLINGGSGGVGTFGIQIAKVLGCRVTAICSTPNVGLCRSLGADDVVDYKKGDIVAQLREIVAAKRSGKSADWRKFDLIVDNVGADLNLYFSAHEYTTVAAKYVMAAGAPALGWLMKMLWIRTRPGVFGGGKREFRTMFARGDAKELEMIATWMKEGKVKAVIDSRWKMEEAVGAFAKLKTGRARGKVVVDVAGDV